MHAALTRLLESLGKHLVREAVDLDVHLGGGDAVCGSRYLEVHVSEVILVSENIGKDGVAVVRMLLVGDEAHGHAGHRFADLHAGVHQGEAAAAH